MCRSASRPPNTPPMPTRSASLRLLEAIRILGWKKETRFYQASTSELYGNGAGSAADGNHAVLSALALWRRQALRLLDHGELPRGLRHACLQRHPVQSRKPDPRRDLRHPQDHPRASPPSQPVCRRRFISAISTPSATGAMPAIIVEGHVADPAAGRARRLRAGDRRDPSVREFVELRFREIGRTIEWRGKGVEENRHRRAKPARLLVAIDPRYFRPTEVDRLLGDATKAQQQARLEAEGTALPSSCARWWRAISLCSPPSRAGSARRIERTRVAAFELRRASASGLPAIAAWWARRWCAGWRSEDCELLTVPRQTARSARPGRGDRLVRSRTAAGGVSGRGQGRRHRRQRQLPGGFSLRQSGHRRPTSIHARASTSASTS